MGDYMDRIGRSCKIQYALLQLRSRWDSCPVAPFAKQLSNGPICGFKLAVFGSIII
jgi:hypothetical protein